MKVCEILESGMPTPKFLDELILTEDGAVVQVLQEGRKWVPGRFEQTIGIDQPTHRAGEGVPHAHVLGRKVEELGVVNLDWTSSHGGRFRLHDADAAELRKRGFRIPTANNVEWLKLRSPHVSVLLG